MGLAADWNAARVESVVLGLPVLPQNLWPWTAGRVQQPVFKLRGRQFPEVDRWASWRSPPAWNPEGESPDFPRRKLLDVAQMDWSSCIVACRLRFDPRRVTSGS